VVRLEIGYLVREIWLKRREQALFLPRERRCAVLSVSWDTIRLFLHVVAATIWVGGQLTLAALVPVLRRLGTEGHARPPAASTPYSAAITG
jgi:hypothetical protein